MKNEIRYINMSLDNKFIEQFYNNFLTDKKALQYMLMRPADNIEDAKSKVSKWLNIDNVKLFYILYNNEVIGFCGVEKVEERNYNDYGIGISSKFTRKGIGLNTLKFLTDYVFNKCQADTFTTSLFSDNYPSEQLMLKFGMKFVKESEETYYRFYDKKLYKLKFYEIKKD